MRLITLDDRLKLRRRLTGPSSRTRTPASRHITTCRLRVSYLNLFSDQTAVTTTCLSCPVGLRRSSPLKASPSMNHDIRIPSDSLLRGLLLCCLNVTSPGRSFDGSEVGMHRHTRLPASYSATAASMNPHLDPHSRSTYNPDAHSIYIYKSRRSPQSCAGPGFLPVRYPS